MPKLNVMKKFQKTRENETIKYYYFLPFFTIILQSHNYKFFKLEKKKKLNYWGANPITKWKLME